MSVLYAHVFSMHSLIVCWSLTILKPTTIASLMEPACLFFDSSIKVWKHPPILFHSHFFRPVRCFIKLPTIAVYTATDISTKPLCMIFPNSIYNSLQACLDNRPRHGKIETNISFGIVHKECIAAFKEDTCFICHKIRNIFYIA
mgnify:CR=1 FL=1